MLDLFEVVFKINWQCIGFSVCEWQRVQPLDNPRSNAESEKVVSHGIIMPDKIALVIFLLA